MGKPKNSNAGSAATQKAAADQAAAKAAAVAAAEAAAKEAAAKEAADKAEAEAAAKEAADKEAADRAAADQAAAEAGAEQPEQSVEDACAELGLTIDDDGQCALEMLTGLSGPDINLVRGNPHRCPAAEAVRLVRADFAAPRGK